MHDLRLRERVRALAASGVVPDRIASDLGLPQATVRRWLGRRLATDLHPPSRCFRCHDEPARREWGANYAYLLGQYLGDGHLVTSSRTPVLRIYACSDYPGVVREIADVITAVRGRPPARMSASNSERLAKLQSYWMHWPCLFPQHGPGRKHERPIVLAAWQREIVAEHPWPLIRGLIHSDGCRAMNRVTARGVRYAYPRYFFANESADILGIMAEALDRVGVAWRLNRPNSISIARRESVAKLDAHVGPKR